MEGTAMWADLCLVASELPVSILERATRDAARH
jgi:hypothetical protein